MSAVKVTKRQVIERLWAVLDASMHQAQWAPHVHREYTDGKLVTHRTDVRKCGVCKSTVRDVGRALKGLRFTEADAEESL